MITFSPERQNLWQNWIDNCFFIETFGLWTKSVSEDTQKAIETHAHTREKTKKCITGFELLLPISVALLPNLAGTLSLSLFLTFCIIFQDCFLIDFFGIFSVVTPRSTSANRRWSCSVDLLTRSFSAISWSTMLVLFFFFYLALFLICVFLIILSNSLDLAFWVFLILLFCSPFFFFFCFSLLYLIGDHRLCF